MVKNPSKELLIKYPNVDFTDQMVLKRSNGIGYRYLYRVKCISCNIDRGYHFSYKRFNGKCLSCSKTKYNAKQRKLKIKQDYLKNRESDILRAKKYYLKNREKILLNKRKKIIKKCNECFINFLPTSNRSKFCSSKCRKNSHKVIYTKTCKTCNCLYDTTKSLKKYCSNFCRVNNPINKIKDSIRTRMYALLKGTRKDICSIFFLGETVFAVKKHLESNFKQGMTWDNHGKWHIDHIKPLASFDLTKEIELKKACHYTNLQPLWAKDNLSKGAKYEVK